MTALAALERIATALPWIDWVALGAFFAGWFAYTSFASSRNENHSRPSLLAVTNRERRRWMLQATRRENRVLDGIVVQNLSASPQFFASTTILIIGGLLAVLSATDQAGSQFASAIPFAARTSALVFDVKVVLLTAIFVYAFFRFTWSLRQYSFGVLLVASAPDDSQITDEAQREAFANRAGRVVGLAAETFNDGIRAYYMAFAATAWFFSPWAMLAATAGVLFVLYQREFSSVVLAVLRD